MTETDDKLSFDTSKEETVQVTEEAQSRSHSAPPFPNQSARKSSTSLPPAQSDSRPRKTLLGMAITLPPPDLATPASAEKTTTKPETGSHPPELPGLSALRDKLALAKNKSVIKNDPPQIASPPVSPLLERISRVGYDDSYDIESSAKSLDIDDNIEDLPEILIQDSIDDLPEIQIQESIDDLPEISIEESLELISDIIPLDADMPVENATQTGTVDVPDQFEDEATQIGSGLFDVSKNHDTVDDADFDDEHTQISEGLRFQHDAKVSLSEVQRDDEQPEIASSAVNVPSAQPGHIAISAAHTDDFDDEKTALYDSPFENDPICPKLTVLSGPALGMEFLVNKMRNSIGRGTNNTIVVPDPSMSRQHYEINQSLDESFVLRDLQAVNGTFLNGTRIIEADLFHGDRIEAGKTVIQFLIGSTAPQLSKNRRIIPASTVANEHLQVKGPQATFSGVPLAASSSNSRDPGQIATYVALTCALLCIPLLALIVFITPSKTDSAAEQQPPHVERGQTASQTYLAGVEAVKQREWMRARALFLQTLELEPNFDGISAQLTRIESELIALQLFEDAQANIERKENDRALLKARSISQNSVYFDEAQKLIRQARQHEVFTIFDDARANFDQGRLDQASQLLNELLEIVPEHGEGIELKTRIDQLNKKELERKQAATRAANAPQKPSTSALNTIDWANTEDANPSAAKTNAGNTQARADAPVINFTEGFTHYRARNFEKAIEHFQHIASATPGAVGQRAEQTVSNIRRFETSFNNGQAAFQKSNWAEAARHFQEAHRADIAVGGASGYFSNEISEKIARSFGELGMAAFNAKQYQRAFTSLQRGYSHHSADATLNKLSIELTNHASSLYNQAVQLKTSNPRQAAEHCRTILTMVDSNTPAYINAQKLLNTL